MVCLSKFEKIQPRMTKVQNEKVCEKFIKCAKC